MLMEMFSHLAGLTLKLLDFITCNAGINMLDKIANFDRILVDLQSFKSDLKWKNTGWNWLVYPLSVGCHTKWACKTAYDVDIRWVYELIQCCKDQKWNSSMAE